METEVVMMLPSPAVDFNFDSGCTTPYLTCPSSPQPFGTFFFSTPTSPSSISTSVNPPSPNPPTNLHNPVNDFYDFDFNFTEIRPIIPQSPIRFGTFSNNPEIENPQNYNQENEQGRERSVSPYRDTEIYYRNGRDQQGSTSNSNSSSSSSGFSSSRVTKKWRFRDLFRSSSATKNKNNYALLKKASAVEEEVKCSSFRSTGSAGSSRRRGAVELHYTVNRAMAEEMRKKTFLPYRRGLFGCMGFSPAVNCSVR